MKLSRPTVDVAVSTKGMKVVNLAAVMTIKVIHMNMFISMALAVVAKAATMHRLQGVVMAGGVAAINLDNG